MSGIPSYILQSLNLCVVLHFHPVVSSNNPTVLASHFKIYILNAPLNIGEFVLNYFFRNDGSKHASSRPIRYSSWDAGTKPKRTTQVLAGRYVVPLHLRPCETCQPLLN